MLSFSRDDVGLSHTSALSVRDLFQRRHLTCMGATFTTWLEPHDVIAVRLSTTSRSSLNCLATTFLSASSAGWALGWAFGLSGLACVAVSTIVCCLSSVGGRANNKVGNSGT